MAAPNEPEADDALETVIEERIEKFFEEIEATESELPEHKPEATQAPDRPLTDEEEKARVLRKVLGDKYQEDGDQ